MRSIINISLPESLALEIRREVKDGKYASVSELFRYLWRMWKEERLIGELNNSITDYKNGKFMLLKSLKDLQ